MCVSIKPLPRSRVKICPAPKVSLRSIPSQYASPHKVSVSIDQFHKFLNFTEIELVSIYSSVSSFSLFNIFLKLSALLCVGGFILLLQLCSIALWEFTTMYPFKGHFSGF